MGRYENLAGKRFGRLTVIKQDGRDPSNKILWLCKCDCGNTSHVTSQRLKNGHTQSCGCYNKDRIKAYFTTHGGTGSRLFSIWRSMKTRCYNKKHKGYRYYGGRGITICADWLHDFSSFRDWALSHGYRDDLTIDRIDNNCGYSPDNCRWATMHEQNINKRRHQQPDSAAAEHTDGKEKE